MKSLLLERKLDTLADSLEKKEAQLNEVLAASNLDPNALGIVNRKLEVNILIYQCLAHDFTHKPIGRKKTKAKTELNLLNLLFYLPY